MSGMYDFIIIGGGLAGLAAAAKAEQLGMSAFLVDAGIPQARSSLGGFAPFSGAKFSLSPAGSGIALLVGGQDALIEQYRETCLEFVELGFDEFALDEHELVGNETDVEHALAYRGYHSVLLSPNRMDSLLAAMGARLSTTVIVRARAQKIALSTDQHQVVLCDGRRVAGRSLIVAAGRLGAELLENAGVPQTKGKGIDVGVRLSFDSLEPVAHLRSLGPDAKIMADGVRTFCLNSPGKIFHYPGLGYQIPGGIVAAEDWTQANVGILCRSDDRDAALAHFALRDPAATSPIVQRGSRLNLGWNAETVDILGGVVVARLDNFVDQLAKSGLLNLPDCYDVHLPLLDWHWPVFSLPGRLETGVGGVFAAGDVSGHARGLLQAAVMGRLAVEEALR